MKLARKAGLINTKKITISYTGKMTQEDVVMADGKYRLLTLTSSGTLTLSAPTMIEACIVGGGAGGQAGSYSQSGGGAGAYMKNVSFARSTGGKAVIGAGGAGNSYNRRGGSSSFIGESVDAVSDRNGGTGGGGNANFDDDSGTLVMGTPGTGDGESKYPFGDENFFSGKPHCAGGGGGGGDFTTSSATAVRGSGGDGGTNGGNGNSGSSGSVHGGAGGVYGGGAGGQGGERSGSDATFYGGGGGAGGQSYDGSTGRYSTGGNGSGYQGVVYVRILTGNLAPLK